MMKKYLALIFLLCICLPGDSVYARQTLADVQENKESASVALSLKGMKQYADFAGLKAFLQSRPQIVKSFYPCRLERQQAHFDLMVVGSVRNLLVDLENSGKYSVETRYKNQDIAEITLQVKEEVQ